jgi:hypothetical protein
MITLIKKYGLLLLAVLFFVLVGTVVSLIDQNANQRAEIKRQNANVGVLNDTIASYRTKSGKLAVKVQELTYTVAELKRYEKANTETIKDLRLKLKQVKSITNIGVETLIRDTLLFRDTVILNDTVRCFKLIDEYVTLLGCARGDSVEIDFKHKDKLTAVAHWNYKKWWIFKFRDKKNISMTIVGESPYSEITYSKYITIK